ncbi:MAG: 4-(cytidine 5'-diphospho)-2-C-methyl-D-erythritol kinase [Ilumatobacteraceae bacterium]
MSQDQAPTTMRLEAPAKLTLELRMTGVRDDGYHLIDATMVTLELHDVVEFRTPGRGLTASGPFADGVPLGPENLVAKALALTGTTAAIHLHKRIPHGGGLGGGSADAAAVLRWAGWTDVAGASRLGADVSFCLVGGRARVRGIGEQIEPLDPMPEAITTISPPFGCSTPVVYRAWDDLGGPRSSGPNDLEPAALAVEPRLAQWRDRIREVVGTPPILAGSGATWFVRGAHPELVDACPDGHVVVTRTRA